MPLHVHTKRILSFWCAVWACAISPVFAQENIGSLVRRLNHLRHKSAKINELNKYLARNSIQVHQARKIYKEAFAPNQRMAALRILVHSITDPENKYIILEDFPRRSDKKLISRLFLESSGNPKIDPDPSDYYSNAYHLRGIDGIGWILDLKTTAHAIDGYRKRNFTNRHGVEIDTLEWMREFSSGPGNTCAVHMSEYPGGFPCRWELFRQKAFVVFDANHTGGVFIRGEVKRIGDHLKVPVPIKGQLNRYLYFLPQITPVKSQD
jgi:Domain of unknown function (DUF4476)